MTGPPVDTVGGIGFSDRFMVASALPGVTAEAGLGGSLPGLSVCTFLQGDCYRFAGPGCRTGPGLLCWQLSGACP